MIRPVSRRLSQPRRPWKLWLAVSRPWKQMRLSPESRDFLSIFICERQKYKVLQCKKIWCSVCLNIKLKLDRINWSIDVHSDNPEGSETQFCIAHSSLLGVIVSFCNSYPVCVVKSDYIRIFAANVGFMSRRSTTHKNVSGATLGRQWQLLKCRQSISVRVSRPLCKYQRMAAREMGLVHHGRRGRWGEINNLTLWTFYFYEPISRNLSRENAKP